MPALEAYIQFRTVSNGARRASAGADQEALVISDQDYHERGPFAFSHRTASGTRDQVREAAEAWATRNGYEIVPSYHITG